MGEQAEKNETLKEIDFDFKYFSCKKLNAVFVIFYNENLLFSKDELHKSLKIKIIKNSSLDRVENYAPNTTGTIFHHLNIRQISTIIQMFYNQENAKFGRIQGLLQKSDKNTIFVFFINLLIFFEVYNLYNLFYLIYPKSFVQVNPLNLQDRLKNIEQTFSKHNILVFSTD
jgi:hypothetical protein